MHELWSVRGHYLHFLLLLPSDAPVVGHAGEHNIGSMFLWVLVLYGTDWSGRRLLGLRRRRSGRRRRQESISLGDSGLPMTLPSGVVGRLCAAVELAWGVKGLLKGEGGQPCSLATFLPLGVGMTSRLLIFDRCYLPGDGG